jgi:hypothetical protein
MHTLVWRKSLTVVKSFGVVLVDNKPRIHLATKGGKGDLPNGFGSEANKYRFREVLSREI